MRKARVLPEPVLAMPTMSRPSMHTGHACAWMGDGDGKPARTTSERSCGGRLAAANVRMGSGQPAETATSCAARHEETSPATAFDAPRSACANTSRAAYAACPLAAPAGPPAGGPPDAALGKSHEVSLVSVFQ